MIAHINDTIVFQQFYIATLVGATGLTVTVDVYRDGTLLDSDLAATEVGGGLYQLSYASTATAGRYTAIFKTSSASVAVKHLSDTIFVGTDWLQDVFDDQGYTEAKAGYIDSSISSRASTASVESIPSYPVYQYNLLLTRNTAYSDIGGNALFSNIVFENDIDLTTVDIELAILYPGTPDTFAGVAVTFNTCYVELTANEVNALADGDIYYVLRATLASSQIITIATGIIRVVS